MRTLYRASRVHTLSPIEGGEWLLVDERHVERVGTGEPPEADQVVDLPGTTIIPGFVDAHVHLTGTGMAASGLHLGGTGSREEAMDRVRAYLSDHPGPVLAQGLDESVWRDHAFPTLAELETLSQEPLILLRADGYLALANTVAIERSRAFEHEGAERNTEGRFTGVLRGRANAQLQRWHFESLSDLDIRDAQLRATTLAASHGVTCVQEMSMPDKRGRRDVEVLLAMRQEYPVHIITYVADMDIPFVMGHRLPRIGGDLFLDGSLGAHTAALLEPYADGTPSGELAYGDDELAEFLHNAHLAGLQVGLHAIGDAAIDQALHVWERVYAALDSRNRRHFRARRHRLEHFEMAAGGRVERAGALGLAISVQPVFDSLWGHPGGMYEQRLGEERAQGMNPFRTMLERGIEVGAGSDSPVTDLDPMLAIWAMETHHDPGQRLGREQAVRLHTVGAARIGHLAKRGRLEPGFSADFAAYEADPFSVPDLRGLRPVLTVCSGRESYRA